MLQALLRTQQDRRMPGWRVGALPGQIAGRRPGAGRSSGQPLWLMLWSGC